MKHIAKLITILLLSIMTAFSAKVYGDDNNTGNGNNDAPKHIQLPASMNRDRLLSYILNFN